MYFLNLHAETETVVGSHKKSEKCKSEKKAKGYIRVAKRVTKRVIKGFWKGLQRVKITFYYRKRNLYQKYNYK